jgi:hypothetical protein
VTCGAQPPLKIGPRGYPSDHPRVELLRWKGAVAIQEYERADWMHTPVARDRIREVWHAARPLKEWIDAHVGATDEPVRSARPAAVTSASIATICVDARGIAKKPIRPAPRPR